MRTTTAYLNGIIALSLYLSVPSMTFSQDTSSIPGICYWMGKCYDCSEFVASSVNDRRRHNSPTNKAVLNRRYNISEGRRISLIENSTIRKTDRVCHQTIGYLRSIDARLASVITQRRRLNKRATIAPIPS